MLSQKIYLDNAASTPVKQEVINAFIIGTQHFGNPSSTHSFGRTAKAMLEQARKNISKTLSVSSSEIFFTSGGSEANNFILWGAVRQLQITHIITSYSEHHSVLHTIEAIQNQLQIKVTYLTTTQVGSIDLQELETILSENSSEKTLVSLMHINNETGVILPLEKIGSICKKYNAFFHSDTVQSVGHYPLHFSENLVDFATASAHKFHGIKGVGFAFIRKNIKISPLIFGGVQEQNLRGGTEALPSILAMDKALYLAYNTMEISQKHISELKNYFVKKLREKIPNVRFNAQSDQNETNAYFIVNVGFIASEQKKEIALFYLDMKGIACSQGSACQSGSQQPSHTLEQILSENELNEINLRFSFSEFNTFSEIDYTISVLETFIKN